MKIYIEVLIPFVIMSLVTLWFFWLKLSTKWHKWRYKPENDRGEKGEEHRKELIRAGLPDPITTVAKTIVDTSGQREPTERSDLPTATSDDVGTNSNSVGKGNPTGFFSRFRRR